MVLQQATTVTTTAEVGVPKCQMDPMHHGSRVVDINLSTPRNPTVGVVDPHGEAVVAAPGEVNPPMAEVAKEEDIVEVIVEAMVVEVPTSEVVVEVEASEVAPASEEVVVAVAVATKNHGKRISHHEAAGAVNLPMVEVVAMAVAADTSKVAGTTMTIKMVVVDHPLNRKWHPNNRVSNHFHRVLPRVRVGS